MWGYGVKAEVGEAIEELKRAFPSSEFAVSEDGEGGAYVVVERVVIGARYDPEHSWLGGGIFLPNTHTPISIRCSWTLQCGVGTATLLKRRSRRDIISAGVWQSRSPDVTTG